VGYHTGFPQIYYFGGAFGAGGVGVMFIIPERIGHYGD